MRSLSFISVVVSGLLLGACSGGGGGSVVPEINENFEFRHDFKPDLSPPGAASKEYENQVSSSLLQFSQNIPAQEAYFGVVIRDSDIRYIWDDSAERTKAQKTLSPEGLRLLKDIKVYCVINDAVKKESRPEGDPQEGDKITKILEMSTSGANCPLSFQKSVDSEWEFYAIETDKESGKTQTSMTLNSQQKIALEVKDTALIKSGILKELKAEISFQGNKTTWRRVKAADESKVYLLGRGVMTLTLANGDVITGPVTIETVSAGDTHQSQMLFEGKSAQGNVKVVLLDKAGSSPEAFINGTKSAASIELIH